MAYCPPDLLDDLADLLAEVRTWAWGPRRNPTCSTCAVSRSSISTWLKEGGAGPT
jgi:hypothetical protein